MVLKTLFEQTFVFFCIPKYNFEKYSIIKYDSFKIKQFRKKNDPNFGISSDFAMRLMCRHL